MNPSDFKTAANDLIDWMVNYREGLRDRPVRPDVAYGETSFALTGTEAPELPEAFADVMRDFEEKILPGITHWQHPRFFAYFPANALWPSVLAEMLMAALGVNTMLWETCPAATELEEEMMRWLAEITGLPNQPGVIQSTASEAAVVALLAGRQSVDVPLDKQRVYTSREAHSSIEKAGMITGYPADAIRLVPVKDDLSMDATALETMVEEDARAGFTPVTLIGTAGTTSTGAFDNLNRLADIAEGNGLYFHVDAAWAGSAMIAPEFRPLIAGIERADSLVYNPHKWMGIQFDCTAHYVKDKARLISTLGILPEYLKGSAGEVTDYRDWGIPLGRRARGIKVWFTLRLMGLAAIRQMIRDHVQWAAELAEDIRATDGFEIVTEPSLSLFTFRLVGSEPDDLNQRLLDTVNRDGFTYLTKTKVKGDLAIRWQIGPHSTTRDDVFASWQRVKELAEQLSP